MAHAIQLVQPRGAVPDLVPGNRRGTYGSSRPHRLSVVSAPTSQATCWPAPAGPFAAPSGPAMRLRPAARSRPAVRPRQMARSRSATRPGYGAVGAAVITLALAALVWNGLQPAMADATSSTSLASRVAAPAPAPPAPAPPAPGTQFAHADEVVTVVVRPGDTVWDLARAATPAGVAPEDYIATVVLTNDIDARRLAPGTTLLMP